MYPSDGMAKSGVVKVAALSSEGDSCQSGKRSEDAGIVGGVKRESSSRQ